MKYVRLVLAGLIVVGLVDAELRWLAAMAAAGLMLLWLCDYLQNGDPL